MFLHQHGLSTHHRAVDDGLRATFGRVGNFGSRVTVVVQTGRAERWLTHIIDFYRDIGLSPMFTLDSTTSAETHAILASAGAACIDIAGMPQEESMAAIFHAVNTEWLLLTYDHELPTPGLLAFVDQAVNHFPGFVWGFPRVRCRFVESTEELQYSQFLPFGPLANADRQWRLMARYDGVREQRTAASDALLLSFNWIARSLAERVDPLRTAPLASFASLDLQEAIPEPWHMWATLPDERFTRLARALHLTRSDTGGPSS